ncbi:MAG: cupredoxin domain-containing protein [Tepidiformaceae bacterium]
MTRPRNGFIVAAAIAAIALAAFAFGRPASAATQSVNVGTPTNRFTANVITINAGDTVTFNWSAGTHVVDLMDISPDLPIDSGHTSGVTVPLTTPGTYYFYCSIHATADQATEAHVQANDAMVGKIVVLAAAANPTSTTAAATATAGPSKSPAAPSTGSGSASRGSANEWMIVLAGGLLAATAIIGTTVVASRRR